jgi:AraC family transcriptional regulator of adaptative response/methylated-DNA-[protein]-cysteine methyltransferase
MPAMNSTARSGVQFAVRIFRLAPSSINGASLMSATTISNVRLNFRTPGAAEPNAVQYGIGSCSQGVLLVARSTAGICAIFIGDTIADLREQIALAFPTSTLDDFTEAMQHDLVQVATFIDEPASHTPLDLSVGGTLFQQRVWQVLCEIPAGLTRSYAEIAQLLDSPDAVRAVAGACAANMLAIAIPCHRVIRSDGSISGYRWGAERKRSLLKKERLQ